MTVVTTRSPGKAEQVTSKVAVEVESKATSTFTGLEPEIVQFENRPLSCTECVPTATLEKVTESSVATCWLSVPSRVAV